MNIKFLSTIKTKITNKKNTKDKKSYQNNKNNKIKFSFKAFKDLKIRTRILGMFLVIITAAIAIATGVTYSVGKSNLENMISNQLNNSVHAIVEQISLLTSAYSSKEFSGKLNYVLTSEMANFKQSGFETEIYLLNSDGTVVDRSNVNAETDKKSNLPDSFIKLAIKQKKGSTEMKLDGKDVTIAYSYVLAKDWIYAVAVTKSSYLGIIYKQQMASIASGVICIFLALILSMLGTRGIVNSIKELNNTVTAAGAGKLGIRSRANHGGPEIANLSNSLNLMLSNIQHLLGEIGTSIEELTTSSTKLNEIAKKTEDSTTYVYGLTQKMSEDSEEQNRFAVQMTESANQLIKTIEDVTHKVNNAASLSELMINSARQGMKTMSELNEFMSEIEKVSDKTVDFVNILDTRSVEINKITNTIKNISGQTRLLSLNASIEAARAGEYGQGFMVVAHEIQNLAHNSARSAVEVEEIVKDIRSNTEAALKVAQRGKEISHQGMRMANTTDQAFNDILDKVSETHDNVRDISEKAQQITGDVKIFEVNSDKILNVINQMAASSQEVAVEVEKHHSISSDVIKNAENLLNVASNFGQIKSTFTTD